MTWAVIAAVGLGSYLLRALPLHLGERLTTSPRIERTIAHAGTAALAALIATGLRPDAVATGETATTMAAAGVALVVALRGGSLLKVLLWGGAAAAVAWSALSLLG
jgi:branched-subunit amino acid transport protein